MTGGWEEQRERWCARALSALVALPGGVALALIALAAAFSPERIARGDHFAWTGLVREPCPGCALCGMSRALAALAHGQVGRALDYHPGVLAMGPLLLVVVLVATYGFIELQRRPPRFFSPTPRASLDQEISTP